jgi:hypothetical protein
MLSYSEMIKMMMCPRLSYSGRSTRCGVLFANCSTTSAGCLLFSDFGGIGSYTRGYEFHAIIHVIYATVHLYHAAGGSLY